MILQGKANVKEALDRYINGDTVAITELMQQEHLTQPPNMAFLLEDIDFSDIEFAEEDEPHLAKGSSTSQVGMGMEDASLSWSVASSQSTSIDTTTQRYTHSGEGQQQEQQQQQRHEGLSSPSSSFLPPNLVPLPVPPIVPSSTSTSIVADAFSSSSSEASSSSDSPLSSSPAPSCSAPTSTQSAPACATEAEEDKKQQYFRSWEGLAPNCTMPVAPPPPSTHPPSLPNPSLQSSHSSSAAAVGMPPQEFSAFMASSAAAAAAAATAANPYYATASQPFFFMNQPGPFFMPHPLWTASMAAAVAAASAPGIAIDQLLPHVPPYQHAMVTILSIYAFHLFFGNGCPDAVLTLTHIDDGVCRSTKEKTSAEKGRRGPPAERCRRLLLFSSSSHNVLTHTPRHPHPERSSLSSGLCGGSSSSSISSLCHLRLTRGWASLYPYRCRNILQVRKLLILTWTKRMCVLIEFFLQPPITPVPLPPAAPSPHVPPCLLPHHHRLPPAFPPHLPPRPSVTSAPTARIPDVNASNGTFRNDSNATGPRRRSWGR